MTGLLNDDVVVDTGTAADGPVTAAGRRVPECTCKPPRWPQWNDAGDRMEHSPDCLRWEPEPESRDRHAPAFGFRLDRPEIEGGPEPAERTDHQVAVSQAQLLEEILTELRHANARASAGESRSSASVKTSARGVDLDVKSYADGLLPDAIEDAIEGYARGMRRIAELQANQWADTLAVGKPVAS